MSVATTFFVALSGRHFVCCRRSNPDQIAAASAWKAEKKP
jgi:hypothetical protein